LVNITMGIAEMRSRSASPAVNQDIALNDFESNGVLRMMCSKT
jgi:hypothetical protein